MPTNLYNPVQSLFEDAMAREGKFIYDYWTNTPIECFFRRNKDTNQMNNNITIFCRTAEAVQAGHLIKYNDRVFLALNQETVENSVYRKIDLIETNLILNTYSNGQELSIPCYAYDLTNPNLYENRVISALNGSIELITEQCNTSEQVAIDSELNVMGGTYKVVNQYYKSGICHIFIERAPSSTITYALTINSFEQFAINTSEQLTVTATRTQDDIVSEVANPTITWESSDPNVAAILATGEVSYNSVGTATITATWVEHGTTATLAVNVADVPATLECSIAGAEYITMGRYRTYTATFYDAAGNVDTTVTPVWSLTVTDEQAPHVSITSQTGMTCRVTVANNVPQSQYYTFFNLNLSDADGRYNASYSIEISDY